MAQSFTRTPTKTHSKAFQPRGVWLGTVTRFDSTTNRAWVKIPRVNTEHEWGPSNVLSGEALIAGDRVACMFVENRVDDIVVMGRVMNSSSPSLVIPQIVTSATRPSSPIDGQIIYETDTNLLLVWDGVSWEEPVTPNPASHFTVVADAASRPGSPATGDVVYQQDVRSIFVYDGTGWKDIRQVSVVADFASRPSSPETGDLILQQDERALFVYDGVGWVDVRQSSVAANAASLPSSPETGDVAYQTDIAQALFYDSGWQNPVTPLADRWMAATTDAALGGEGVIGVNDFKITEYSGMTVSASAGSAYVAGTSGSFAGTTYHVATNASATVTVPTADVVNDRIDLIVLQLDEPAWEGAAPYWSIDLVQGTPAASPVEPSLPANSLKLASIYVNDTVSFIQNSDITDARTRWAPWELVGPIIETYSEDPTDANTNGGWNVFGTGTTATLPDSWNSMLLVVETTVDFTVFSGSWATLGCSLQCDGGNPNGLNNVGIQVADALTVGANYRQTVTSRSTHTATSDVALDAYVRHFGFQNTNPQARAFDMVIEKHRLS